MEFLISYFSLCLSSSLITFILLYGTIYCATRILWYLASYATVNTWFKSDAQHSVFFASRKSTLRQCEKSFEWIRSVKYSTERRFPHGGFEINFDLPPGRLGRNRWTRSLEILIWMKKEGWKKRVRWLFCVGEWLLPKRIRAMNGVTKS